MMVVLVVQFLLLIVMVLISVAFVTLLERKILGFVQLRKGPNKTGFVGILQPFSDALKLLSKEWFFLDWSSYYFMYSPLFMFVSMMMLWYFYPWFFLDSIKYSIIFFMLVLGLNVYPVISVGWSASNNYSMLGTLRVVAQMISFEVSLFLMLFMVMVLIESYSFNCLISYQLKVKFFILIWPVYLCLFLSMLIELNRTPFDLIEGESELVSGFNVEYYGSFFTLIFLAEYASLLFMGVFLTMMFFGLEYWGMLFLIIYMFHVLMLLWMRGVLPRIRYDELMVMCWNEMLLLVLMYLLMIYLIKEFVVILS